uniref:Uncharacterized protein n=1 Tax=Anguilla anguilla TaxID=7936 RepID=A0A0E9WPG1_ANGAN
MCTSWVFTWDFIIMVVSGLYLNEPVPVTRVSIRMFKSPVCFTATHYYPLSPEIPSDRVNLK